MALDGEHIESPPGRFVFAYPKGVVDARERLHLVWAEPVAPDSMRDESWLRNWARRLWYATHDAATGWTLPREIYRSPEPILWRQAPGVKLDALGRVHVIVRHILDGSLLHVVVDGARERTTVVAAPRGAYTDFTIDGDHVFVALMSWAQEHREQKGDVYFMRSSDLGRHWTPLALISPSVTGHAREVQIVVTPDETVHLLWAHSPRGRETPEVVYHVQSRDSGGTWSPVEELDFPNPFTYLRAVVDGCGGIHVASAPWPTGYFTRRRYAYTRWSGRWLKPAMLFPALRPLYVDLTVGHDGTLYWFAPARDLSDRGDERPFPRLATASPRRQ